MAAIHRSVDVDGLPGRLGLIRARFAPGSTLRSFGRVVADERWRKWEGAGDVPGEARLAAALSKLPGVDGLALARWAREGKGDPPFAGGAGAGSARPAERLPEAEARMVQAAEIVALEAAEKGQALTPAMLTLVRTVLDRARGSRWASDNNTTTETTAA